MDKLKKQGSRIAELIEKGREQGYLTYADVNDHLPEDISDPDQVDEIIGMINDLGLQVHETAPDADTLMLSSESNDDQDEIALEQAAEALAAVENETGRTTDPVRMYMREMGTVDLLTREGEIEIAKRIEEGMRDLLDASVNYPGIVEHIIDFYELVKLEEKKLSELLTGFLEEMEEVPSAGPGSEKAKQLEESDEEVDNGPDLVEVKKRMTNLKRQFNKTHKVVESKGRHSKEAKAEFIKLGLIFKFLKFSPKMFEDLAFIARKDLAELRLHEKRIQYLCVKSAKIPRKDFIGMFHDNVTKVKWIDSLMTNKKYSKKSLEHIKPDVVIAQKSIKAMEDRVGLNIKDIRDINQVSLRSQIGVVPQDTVLFNDTIGYNIAYGKLNASKAEVESVAKAAKIHYFIMELPLGYDTSVGERGLKLSGGEKQRISIARAILKKTPIILLDEATSSLDPDTENKIQKGLSFLTKNKTTLVIAHRLSTILNSAKIFVVDKGQLISEGTHEELLENSPIYKNFYEKQIRKV